MGTTFDNVRGSSSTAATVPRSASSANVTHVGGSNARRPDFQSANASPGRCHAASEASVVTPSALCPEGSTATKNHVSYRRGSSSGVNQFAQGRSRSARSTSPSAARNCASDSSRATSASRAEAYRAVSATTADADGPASSTPDSSNVSRTAAHTSAVASSTEHPNLDAHHDGGGPLHATDVSASRGSTPPPGNTVIPPANAIAATRRSRNASIPAAPSRTRTTVAADRGSAGGPVKSSGAMLAGSTSSSGSSRTTRAYEDHPPVDTTRKGCLVNVLLFVVGSIVGTGLTATAAVLLFLPGTTTTSTDEGTPNVYVKERSSLVGGTDREVWLGRTADHGHVVPVPSGWDGTPQVERRADGVELRFDNGARIFVPASTYVGGR